MDRIDFDINNMTQASLASLQADQLITLVLALKEENEIFKQSAAKIAEKKYDERLVKLEREVNKDRQHLRRDTIEFAGISADIPGDKIEDECLGILKAAKVKVGNKFPAAKDVHAAHRKGRKGIVILKFVNRKFAVQALLNRYKLRELDDYSDIFINQSLCPEYSYLNFAVKKAKRNNEISYYKLKNGVSLIQKETDSPFVEISHANDLTENGISIPQRI